MEDKPENLEAVLGEFIDEDEVQRRIEAEWDRMYERGETIRPGDGSWAAFARWFSEWGTTLERIWQRKD